MNSTPEELELLISRISLGDRNALESLYNRTSAKLFGVCLRILKDRTEAEDALQEVYVKIWRGASRYAANRYSPISWLVAIARNHAIDRVRARKPDTVDIDQVAKVSDNAPDPEKAAIASSDRRRIDGCLDELEAAHADAVRGAYLNGNSYQELADRHKVPINTMRTWLRRSLMKLKECLER